ncbi:prolyl 4-hydroxylase subunit alpha-1-like [Nilaparvata lugens]|uniref:prolyl 4-hydroxylase subunit alpha-1-like n=1 Tax=Nilaparvata lugens TaxID=108931 RepID=UPI00193E9340|nr:prolyl 4-hydroxylase subunit alpha-1-like [Nilaparvata lugens]
MLESLKQLEQEGNRAKIKRWQMLEYLAYFTYMQGNVQSVSQMTEELLSIVPNHDCWISKAELLEESEHPSIKLLSRRVEHMASLNMATAERLKVINYCINGNLPHYDTLPVINRDENFRILELNNGNRLRIATVMFYMSDVAQGGATVFLLLKLALWPQKGTAVFWHILTLVERLTLPHCMPAVLCWPAPNGWPTSGFTNEARNLHGRVRCKKRLELVLIQLVQV